MCNFHVNVYIKDLNALRILMIFYEFIYNADERGGGFALLRINKFLEISPSTAFQARAVTGMILYLQRC